MRTTDKGTPIISGRLVPVYGKDGYEIVGVNAVITGCPSCGHRHSHPYEATKDGGDSLALIVKGIACLKPQAAPCSARLTGDSQALKYCIDVPLVERREMAARLQQNRAFLAKQAKKRREESQLARRLMQHSLAEGLRQYDTHHQLSQTDEG